MKTLRFLSAAGVVVLGLAFIGTAQADAVDICTLVTNASGCEVGTENNDKKNVGSDKDQLQVNLDSIFGYTDWLFAEKDNADGDDEEVINVGLRAVQKTDEGDRRIEGNWYINDVWNTYANVMIVFKGANAFDYIGYLLIQDAITGMYSTPFLENDPYKQKQISHWTAYVRGTGSGGSCEYGGDWPNGCNEPPCTGDDCVTQVPEPGTLALLGLALLGLSVSRRRKV